MTLSEELEVAQQMIAAEEKLLECRRQILISILDMDLKRYDEALAQAFYWRSQANSLSETLRSLVLGRGTALALGMAED